MCFVSTFPHLVLCSIGKQCHSRLLWCHEQDRVAPQQGNKLDKHWVITNLSKSSSAVLSKLYDSFCPAWHFNTPTHWSITTISNLIQWINQVAVELCHISHASGEVVHLLSKLIVMNTCWPYDDTIADFRVSCMVKCLYTVFFSRGIAMFIILDTNYNYISYTEM